MSPVQCTCVTRPGHTWDEACPRHGTPFHTPECPEVSVGPRARVRVGRLLVRADPGQVMLLTVYALIGAELVFGLFGWHARTVAAGVIGYAVASWFRGFLDFRRARRERDAARRLEAARVPDWVIKDD